MTAESIQEPAMEGPPSAGCTADCTVDGAGRLLVRLAAAALPPSSHPRLLLVLRPRGGQPEETSHVLELEPRHDGRWHAALDPAPALAEGRWDPYLLAEPGAPRQRLLPGLLDLRAPARRREGAEASLPLAVRIPYVTVDRYVAVRTWLRAAHAEADEIRVGGEALTVRGRLYGARLGDGATALLRRRGGGEIREFGLRAEGERDFTFTVDHRDLLAGRKAEHDVWDAFVRPDAAAASGPGAGAGSANRVRVGRLLDDVADRKNIFVYPTVALDGATTVHPYYTVDNELAVELTAGPGRRTAANARNRSAWSRFRTWVRA